MPRISETEYGKLLDLICTAALEPATWDRVLRRLAELTGSVAGGLTVENPETGRGFPLTFFGFDAEHVCRTFDYYLPQNPLHRIKEQMQAGRVVTNAMATPLETFRRSEFYDGWARPQGLCCPVTVVLHRDGATYAPLTLVRPDGKGDATDEDCTLLARLSPHLMRALRTGIRLRRLEGRVDALDVALLHLGVAVFILDQRGHLTYSNPVAERMLAVGGTVFLGKDRSLVAVGRASDAALQAAVFKVLRDGSAGADVRLERAEGRPLAATVLSMPRDHAVTLPATKLPACLVIIREPDENAHPAMARQAARLYKLTAAEERVLRFLLKGEGLTQAALSLGVSRTTAQTHLKGIFSKTGTHRQGELIELTSRLTPSLQIPSRQSRI